MTMQDPLARHAGMPYARNISALQQLSASDEGLRLGLFLLLLLTAGQGLQTIALVYAYVSSLCLQCSFLDDVLVGIHDFLVLWATLTASGICQGMSWQYLHQPCVARKP